MPRVSRRVSQKAEFTQAAEAVESAMTGVEAAVCSAAAALVPSADMVESVMPSALVGATTHFRC